MIEVVGIVMIIILVSGAGLVIHKILNYMKIIIGTIKFMLKHNYKLIK